MKNDIDVVSISVITSKLFKKNKELVLKAVKHFHNALIYASQELKDKIFLIECYQINNKIKNNIFDDNFINEK